MADVLDVVRERAEASIARLRAEGALSFRGVVRSVGDGVAIVAGLEDIGSEELVAFDSGALGMAYELAPRETGVVLLSGAHRVTAGDGARSYGGLPSIRTGPALLGRLVDPLGAPLDDGPPLLECTPRALFQPAPSLIARRAVGEPLHTGITVIDAAIPIGRGQRELIVGDRDVGKTALGLDIIAAQRDGDVRCVYVAVGQPMSRILAARATLARAGCLDNVVIVAADAAMPAGMQYLAPYAGACVAESFRDEGGDALVVYDDLTKHADAYRELALLLGRPSGREAFPGDIFHIHAELLERAAPIARAKGGGSVTALPIVETTDSDIAGYIPTNLISITDGQIYLDTARFERDERPAVDVGRSVSRIGSLAQPPALRSASRNLRILLARFESLQALTRVGLDVEESTRQTLERGRAMREILRQQRLSPRSVADQVIELTAVSEGWTAGLSPRDTAIAIRGAIARARERDPELLAAFDEDRAPDAQWLARVEALVGSSRTEATR
jgi:F-type H+-transporting ATPase subunit alpha